MEGRREKLKQEQNILNDLKDFLPSISCSPQKKLFYWMCMRFSGFVQTLGNYYFFKISNCGLLLWPCKMIALRNWTIFQF